MAVTITSYTPSSGTAGTTQITITGTNLDTVTLVMVGEVPAPIVGTPTATSLKFKIPAGAAVGTSKVSVFDDSAWVVAGSDLTVSAPSNTAVESKLAGRYAIRVRNVGDTDWLLVRGITTLKPGRDYSTEDDSDTDSGFDGADFVTGRKTNYTFTVRYGFVAGTTTPDPGQELLRVAEDSGDTVEFQYFDRLGGAEAYQGTALVQWAPQGGNKTSTKVDVTLNQQGARSTITNPVLADSTLAGQYA